MTQSLHENGSMDSNTLSSTQPPPATPTVWALPTRTIQYLAVWEPRVKAGQAYGTQEGQAAGRRVLASFDWSMNICYWNKEPTEGSYRRTLISRSLCNAAFA